jgi:hypothetical protein
MEAPALSSKSWVCHGYENWQLLETIRYGNLGKAALLLPATAGARRALFSSCGPIGKPMLLHFARWGHLELVKWVLANGGDPLVRCSALGGGPRNLLQHAAISGNAALVSFVLARVPPSMVDEPIEWHQRYGSAMKITPACTAAYLGHRAVTQLLLDWGANPHAQQIKQPVSAGVTPDMSYFGTGWPQRRLLYLARKCNESFLFGLPLDLVRVVDTYCRVQWLRPAPYQLMSSPMDQMRSDAHVCCMSKLAHHSPLQPPPQGLLLPPSVIAGTEPSHVAPLPTTSQETIRLTAYYIAERSGFRRAALDCWLEAERLLQGRSTG